MTATRSILLSAPRIIALNTRHRVGVLHALLLPTTKSVAPSQLGLGKPNAVACSPTHITVYQGRSCRYHHSLAATVQIQEEVKPVQHHGELSLQQHASAASFRVRYIWLVSSSTGNGSRHVTHYRHASRLERAFLPQVFGILSSLYSVAFYSVSRCFYISCCCYSGINWRID